MLRGLEAHRGRTVLPAWGRREAGRLSIFLLWKLRTRERQDLLEVRQPVSGSASTRMLVSCLSALFDSPNLIFPK